MKKQNQSDRCSNSDRSNKCSSSQTNSTPELIALIEAFERLDQIENPVAFHLEFELERKKLKLNLSTFKAAWQAWQAQRRGGNT